MNDSSYEFNAVLPYYEKSVQFTPPNTLTRAPNATAEYNAGAFSPTGGPLQVSYPNYAMTFSSWMQLGMEAIGVAKTTDFNSGHLLGSQYCSSTIRPSDQSRSSSEASFLSSTRHPGLHIYPGTLVRRVLFNSSKAAIGVEVENAGITWKISATKEVIVSAGAFQSPQVLMVSGIGPSPLLQSLRIPVISDLPGVGQNMWDHPFFAPSYRVGVETLTEIANDPVYLAAEAAVYETTHTGVLTNPISDFLGWEKIPAALRANFTTETQQNLSQFPSDWPEAEVFVFLHLFWTHVSSSYILTTSAVYLRCRLCRKFF